MIPSNDAVVLAVVHLRRAQTAYNNNKELGRAPLYEAKRELTKAIVENTSDKEAVLILVWLLTSRFETLTAELQAEIMTNTAGVLRQALTKLEGDEDAFSVAEAAAHIFSLRSVVDEETPITIATGEVK